MLCARTNAALHDLSTLVPGIAFTAKAFSCSSASFPFGLQERHDWLSEPESFAPGARLLVIRAPAE